MSDPSAPLFTRTYDLVLWLSERTESFPRSQRFGLAARIMAQAHGALESITLALRGFDREDNVERADAALALLWVYLRLACDRKLVRRRQLGFAIERIEELGRMVGGWKKRL
ncbi:MAG: diversity-generating retroelement protein Avd [Deltaproteobacteria bacterium]|nr:diversity-generating retroelement protein Avd [Deltaproteobacteria bacterium]